MNEAGCGWRRSGAEQQARLASWRCRARSTRRCLNGVRDDSIPYAGRRPAVRSQNGPGSACLAAQRAPRLAHTPFRRIDRSAKLRGTGRCASDRHPDRSGRSSVCGRPWRLPRARSQAKGHKRSLKKSARRNSCSCGATPWIRREPPAVRAACGMRAALCQTRASMSECGVVSQGPVSGSASLRSSAISPSTYLTPIAGDKKSIAVASRPVAPA